MWWIDPELRRQLDGVREMVALRNQRPTKEWPLVFVEEFNAWLVVREWVGGKITASAMPAGPNPAREGD